MNSNEEKYELGEDVTQAAAAKERKGSVVLSVRLSSHELAKLEQVAQASGKTISQIVREAVTGFVPMGRTANYGVVISQHGNLVTFGDVSSSVPVRAQTVSAKETPEFAVAR